MTRRILITIEYDGGPFSGWQRQMCIRDRIACGQDALKITKVQPAGKTSMTASDFLNGTALAIGTFLHPEISPENK